jgi:hypothetical protein
MHSTAKFNVVDKQFHEITSSIINMLVSLNPGDEKGFEIIAMVKKKKKIVCLKKLLTCYDF